MTLDFLLLIGARSLIIVRQTRAKATEVRVFKEQNLTSRSMSQLMRTTGKVQTLKPKETNPKKFNTRTVYKVV